MKLAWSNSAIADLRELRRFSVERWGREVALRYLADVRMVARRLAVRPDRARPLNGSFRVARVRSHYLIVRVDETGDVLTIARVLHSAMSLEQHLPSA